MTTNVLPRRGALTDILVAYFTDRLDPVLVGDGVKPPGGGWPAEPGSGDYAKYVVLGTGDAVLRDSPPTMRQAMSAWACGYTIDYFGPARGMADDLADASRDVAVRFAKRHVQLGELWWEVSAVRYQRLGKITRLDTEDPPVWTGTDMFGVWIDLMRGEPG